MSSVAVFWDRDNTLIKDPGYISDPGQVELLPGAAEALKRLTAAGFENIIITNQSGLARGLFDEAALERVHDRVTALFAEHGAKIDAIYFCPYLPGPEAKIEKYRKDSELRKPKPGMILQAALERKIELAGSWMVGDTIQDAQAGRAAGCRTIRIRRPGGEPVRKSGDVDFAVDSIEQAAATVLKYTRRAGGPSQPAKREAAPPTTPVKPRVVEPPAPVERPPERAPSAKRVVEAELAPSAKRGVETELVDLQQAIVGSEIPKAGETPSPPTTTTPKSTSDHPPAPSTNEGVANVPEPSTAVKPPTDPAPIAKREAAETANPPPDLEPPAEPAPSAKPGFEPELAPSAKRGVDEPSEPSPMRKRPAAEPSADAAALLQEILAFLRTVDRRSRADEFAMGKLLGAVAQIVAIGALTWSVFGLIREEPIDARLGFAILFQLMALTCFILSPRK